MVNNEQLKAIGQRIAAIATYLKIPEKEVQLQEGELKTQDPGFWDDPKKAEVEMKTIRSLKFWIESYTKLKGQLDDLEVLIEFVKEGAAEESDVDEAYNSLIEKLDETELKNMLSGEEDVLSAVVQITAGAGGTEACDWASMLMRMYIMWPKKTTINSKSSTTRKARLPVSRP